MITCNICKKDLADGGGTTSLQKHLRLKHVDEAKKCFGKVTDGKKQTPMSTFTDARRCSPARATQITELIAELVACDLCPLSVVEGEGFRQLLNYIKPTFEATRSNRLSEALRFSEEEAAYCSAIPLCCLHQ